MNETLTRSTKDTKIPPLDAQSKPYQRLDALLNILQNGAQSLLVLNMKTAPETESVYTTNTRIKKMIGTRIVVDKTMLNYLRLTLEPLGIATVLPGSNIDWSLTDLGNSLKAPLLFGWDQYLTLGAAPNILGKISKGTREELSIRAPMSRALALASLSVFPTINMSVLAEITTLELSNISEHCHDLSELGLINIESASDKPTSRESETSEETGRDESYLKLLSEILEINPPKKNDDHPWSFSNVSITDLGSTYVNRLLKPLFQWAIDPKRLPEIVKSQQIQHGSTEYAPLYREIVNHFWKYSPGKQADIFKKSRTVYEYIQNNPGLTTRAISRQIGESSSSIGQHVAFLEQSRKVVRRKGRGGSIYLYTAL